MANWLNTSEINLKFIDPSTKLRMMSLKIPTLRYLIKYKISVQMWI